jgi:hypothetical protein
MKKLFSWYNLLIQNNMLDLTEEEETTEAPVSEENI